MRIEGALHPIGNAARFTIETWRQLVNDRPEFRRGSPRKARNPITGETISIQPAPDAAQVVFEGRVVGDVYWSMSEEPLVNVSIEPSAMPLVEQWAAAMGGEFRMKRQ